MTNLERLTIAAWRGHSKALHAALHGSTSADALDVSDATFAKTSPITKRAMTGMVQALLVELRDMVAPESSAMLAFDSISNEPQPEPPPPPARNPNAEPSPAKPDAADKAAV